MHIVVVHKEPIVDRVPNLKSLIFFAANNENKVTLLTTSAPGFPLANFQNHQVQEIFIKERVSRYGLPTLLKVAISLIKLYIKSIYKRKSSVFIFAGRGALIIAGLLSKLGLNDYVAFVVEYPALDKFKNNSESLLDRLELAGIVGGRFYITHDSTHGELINSINDNKKYPYFSLPNATLYFLNISEKSSFLHARLKVSEDRKIILHSGGFGEWFASKELAAKSVTLPHDFLLVFHFSHDVSNDAYFKRYMACRVENDKSIFSRESVATNELDQLVSSAYIGIAWYDNEILGFRAECMGLAAGKIGNYLKCGIPVIAPNFKSLEYINDFNCGVLINNLSEMYSAIKLIENNYDLFSENACTCYEKLWEPEPYLTKILEALSN